MAGRPRKNKVVAFKVDVEFYEEFKKWTKDEGLTISSALRNFMAMKIKQHRDEQLRFAEREKMIGG